MRYCEPPLNSWLSWWCIFFSSSFSETSSLSPTWPLKLFTSNEVVATVTHRHPTLKSFSQRLRTWERKKTLGQERVNIQSFPYRSRLNVGICSMQSCDLLFHFYVVGLPLTFPLQRQQINEHNSLETFLHLTYISVSLTSLLKVNFACQQCSDARNLLDFSSWSFVFSGHYSAHHSHLREQIFLGPAFLQNLTQSLNEPGAPFRISVRKIS